MFREIHRELVFNTKDISPDVLDFIKTSKKIDPKNKNKLRTGTVYSTSSMLTTFQATNLEDLKNKLILAGYVANVTEDGVHIARNNNTGFKKKNKKKF